MRSFNRFYTRHLGILDESLLGSPFTLSEARLLFEIAHQSEPTASVLAQQLGLDQGYVSRMLRDLEGNGLIRRSPSPRDGRRRIITMTDEGAEA
ncbi:MAG: MarR family winged helix-turn-helix transcriptional regulator, partial [Phycisphaerales bacterium JB043]